MSDVSQELVRIFFELNGFFVKSGRYLFISMPKPEKSSSPPLILETGNVKLIKDAIISIKPWHAETFFPSTINSTPEIFSFLEAVNLGEAVKYFGSKNFKKILVLSKLSKVKETLKKTAVLFKQKGIDHVIEFPTILNFLRDYVKRNLNYDNDLLQFARILKCYNMYVSEQLELFKEK